MTSRHLAVFLMTWLTVSCCLNACGAEQPNIVLIVADDLRPAAFVHTWDPAPSIKQRERLGFSRTAPRGP